MKGTFGLPFTIDLNQKRLIQRDKFFQPYIPPTISLFRKIPILMSLLYHNDTIIKKEKELLRALLIQFCKLEVIIYYI